MVGCALLMVSPLEAEPKWANAVEGELSVIPTLPELSMTSLSLAPTCALSDILNLSESEASTPMV